MAARSPGEDGADRLPVLIVGKLCRAVFAEYESRLAPGGAKADWMAGNLRALDAVRARAMQAALVGGECLLKPVPAGGGFEFLPLRRDHFVPLGRDLQGRLLAVGTMERISRGGRAYALLERRTAGPDGLTIETRLFELAGAALGREVPLDALPETAALRPTLLLSGVPGVGLAALRTPLANCVDGSADAVAVFAPAVGLIHRLGRTEHGLRREFENGASRVFASEDLLRGEAPGARDLRDDLFVGLPDDPANLGMTVYSPPLRDQSYLARKQDILRGCENLIGLRRGTLSEADAAERTATEITAHRGGRGADRGRFPGNVAARRVRSAGAVRRAGPGLRPVRGGGLRRCGGADPRLGRRAAVRPRRRLAGIPPDGAGRHAAARAGAGLVLRPAARDRSRAGRRARALHAPKRRREGR